jgi:hypothetical protein
MPDCAAASREVKELELVATPIALGVVDEGSETDSVAD